MAAFLYYYSKGGLLFFLESTLLTDEKNHVNKLGKRQKLCTYILTDMYKKWKKGRIMNKNTLEKVTELRHYLHRHPELSCCEKETKKTLMNFLEENTDLKLTDRGDWFYAEYHPENSRGSIAFRADMDAIRVNETTDLPYRSENPGVAHKCGHDGHSSALAAFAMETEEKGADKDVYFIFQHAEENGVGGYPCSMLLEEKNIDEVYAIHNFPGVEYGTLAIREGTICCASKGMEIHFTGTSAHASQPEKGKNPAEAISRLVLELGKIADPERYTGLILATVVQVDLGERAFGVAAHEGSLLLTIRGQHEKEMDAMEGEIRAFAEKMAEEYGLELEFLFTEEFPETYCHRESVDKIREIAEEQGWKTYEMENPIRSSEDFGWYTKKTKGAMIWLGAGESWPPIHSEDFDFNDGLLEIINNIFRNILEK